MDVQRLLEGNRAWARERTLRTPTIPASGPASAELPLQLSHTVHPRVLDDLGLVAAIEQLAGRTWEQARLRVWVTSAEKTPVPRVVASVLYRVAREAVGNALRHAEARELFLSLRADEREIVLEVRDDGKGFGVAAAESSMRGLGLFSMRERLGLVDGHLTIASGAAGAVVRATVPMRRGASLATALAEGCSTR